VTTPIFDQLVAERPLPVLEDSDLLLLDLTSERQEALDPEPLSAPPPTIPGGVAPVVASDSPQISATTGAKPFWRGKPSRKKARR
jgi:hypothetical protein